MTIGVEQLCSELVKIQSFSGQEKGITAYLSGLARELGFDDARVDSHGNIVMVMKGGRPGKKVLFDSHIDTVEVAHPELWKHQPLGGEIVDGKVYGRGASDMKGALAAQIIGAVEFKKASGGAFAGEVLVAGVCHEECFEGVSAREISAAYKPDYVIIGEASLCNLRYGQRGRAEIVVETFGVPAHSANPQKGVNAVYKMAGLIGAIRDLKLGSDPDLGPNIVELVDIKSLPYPGASVVPDYCRATYDLRLLVGDTPEAVEKIFTDAIAEAARKDPELKAKAGLAVGEALCWTGKRISDRRFFPAWKQDKNSREMQAMTKALEAAGLPQKLSCYGFCTNGSHYAGEAGITTFGFGPSLESLAHTNDEYIEIDQLRKAVTGNAAIARALLG